MPTCEGWPRLNGSARAGLLVALSLAPALRAAPAGAHEMSMAEMGLGFAGALKDIGLPARHLPLALFSFNLGVELGQLLTVLVAYAVVNAPFSQRWLGRARRPALYAIGIVAAFWCWQRVLAIVV